MASSFYLLLSLSLVFFLAACAPADNNQTAETTETNEAAEDDPQAQFWMAMQEHCGNAYEGRLVLEPEGDDMLDGDETLIVHFRECSENEMKVPFHIEKPDGWDRSRTWVYTRDDQGLELRHDHRHEDGTEEETTWYGGRSETQGTAQQQEFIYAEAPADAPPRGWRIQIRPHDTYVYGTFRGDDYNWRVDFDLSTPVEVPPAPWGHE
jgi:hypothetical protein